MNQAIKLKFRLIIGTVFICFDKKINYFHIGFQKGCFQNTGIQSSILKQGEVNRRESLFSTKNNK